MIWKKIDMRRFGHMLAIVILLCALNTGTTARRMETELLSDEDSWNFALRDIDEYLARWLWFNCKLDLMDMKGTFEGMDLCHTKEILSCIITKNQEKHSLTRRNLRKALSLLPPQIKRSLLDCLEKQNVAINDSGEVNGYKSWSVEYLEYLFRWPDSSRRYLIDDPSGIAITPAPSPDVLPPAPSPSADPPAPSSEAPSPGPISEVPQPYRDVIPPTPARHIFDEATTPATSDISGPGQNPSESSKHGNNKKVIVAVVVTAGATFFIAALMFCCYRKRKNSIYGPKDESPLLSISMSDYSGDSSHKSTGLGHSVSKDKFGNLSFSTPSHNGRPSSIASNFSLGSDVEKFSVIGGSALGHKSSIESPAVPDNTSTPVTSLPPLKPPPGRAGPPPPAPPPQPPAPPPPRAPPPPPPGVKPGSRPPPPPVGGAPPRPPQPFAMKPKVSQPSPLGKNPSGTSSGDAESGSDGSKTKLKPFFWDKVLANPDQSMVWHQIKSGSFQFNEEMIETLFGYNNGDKNKNLRTKDYLSQDPSTQYIQIIDSKKAQNLSILLRALNLTTEEVCAALYEGTELPMELCQTLLKMAPTADEELKLRLYDGDLAQLGPAERFLKVLVNIPFAFKRLDSLCFMSSYQEEVSSVKESLATLEVACKELKNSRLFLKLLEAVLKTGNRMNDGTFRGGAQAFKLDTLLKLADVKGTDGKTTLLQFVVQEIIRSEGIRAARVARESQSLSSVKSEDLYDVPVNESEDHYRSLGLQVVSWLGTELENVKKASVLDADALSSTLGKLGLSLGKSRDFLITDMKNSEDDSQFQRTLENFVQNAEVDIKWLQEEEKRIMALVRSTADYFHGNAKKDEGLRLFVIVRNFLAMIDKTCKEVKDSAARPMRTPRNKDGPSAPASSADLNRRLFPAITDRRTDHSSSDDEDS